MAPAVLPGKGLAQHDFFYAGEQKQHRMFLVRNGKVVWSYVEEQSRGEISDAVLMSNGNIVFAHQFGVTVITPEKKVIWTYDAPDGCEIHTAQPIGTSRVLFIQNGNPAVLRVVNIITGTTERQFNLPVGNPDKVHGQFRHARLTDVGTVLVAHMDMKRVSEYDSNGREISWFPLEGPWSAVRLKNGNVLVATNKKLVQEIDPQGRVVWELKPEDLSGYKISGFQIATRLANGNTLVNNWTNTWSTQVDKTNAPVQALEVTPDKKIVWALRAWGDPVDLGPATTIQLLDEVGTPESVRFGDIQ